VLNADGALTAGLVCGRCALRAVAFVVPPAVTVPTLCVSCQRERACVCQGCAERLAANVRELSKANVRLAVGKGGEGG